MTLDKKVRAWTVAALVAGSLVLKPMNAQAAVDGEAVPFMVFAAAFTVTIIIIAINNPTTDTTNTGAATSAPTTSSTSALRAAPPPRVIGFTAHF